MIDGHALQEQEAKERPERFQEEMRTLRVRSLLNSKLVRPQHRLIGKQAAPNAHRIDCFTLPLDFLQSAISANGQLRKSNMGHCCI